MKKAPMRITYRLVCSLVRGLARVFFGFRIYGSENVPLTGKLLIVSNHISALDPPIVGASIPREVFVAAKIDLFKGFLGKFISHFNARPVRRQGSDKEIIKLLSGLLLQDNAVLIYPEGTRTLDEEDHEPKLGVGMLAVMTGSDLIPMRIDGSHKPKKALFRPRGITVRFGNVISLDSIINEDMPKKEMYRQVAYKLMEEIRSLRFDKEKENK